MWHDGELYVQERNSEDIAAFHVDAADGGLSIVADGAPFKTLAVDPMPAHAAPRAEALLLGQQRRRAPDPEPLGRLYELPPRGAEQRRHVEVRRGSSRRALERGRHARYGLSLPHRRSRASPGLLEDDRPGAGRSLQPVRPERAVAEGAARRAGRLRQLRHSGRRSRRRRPTRRSSPAASSSSTTRRRPRAPAATRGPNRTDSGQGNPTLDLSGPILLHDVGTCVTSGPWPDVAHDDITGAPRAACAFDTPALRGLSDSAPYLHDGSAATLDDVIPIMLQATAPSCTTPRTALSPADRARARRIPTQLVIDHEKTAHRLVAPRCSLVPSHGVRDPAAPAVHVRLRDVAEGERRARAVR